MNLKSRAAEALQTLGNYLPQPTTIDCSDGSQHLRCELLALDSLACSFERFEVEIAALAAANMDRLKSVAETLSRRLTYLLEPISPIETDQQQCVVQLRSNPPQKDENGSSYYELLVQRGGRLSLCRWAKEPGQVRRTVPAHVTREVFLRLVADFAAAAT